MRARTGSDVMQRRLCGHAEKSLTKARRESVVETIRRGCHHFSCGYNGIMNIAKPVFTGQLVTSNTLRGDLKEPLKTSVLKMSKEIDDRQPVPRDSTLLVRWR